MIIALYFLIEWAKEWPVTITAWLQVFAIVLAPIVVVIAGIMLICNAAGVRISQNLGATLANGIFSAMGYVARNVVNAAIWIGRRALRMIPRVFTGSRRMFRQMGISEAVSIWLAILVTILYII